jgi:hypothetical protein
MTRLIPFAAPPVALLLALAPASALAQARTGTGGGPDTTATAPNTTSVGQTKPPSGAGGTREDSRSGDRTQQEKADDKISRGICIGCGPK